MGKRYVSRADAGSGLSCITAISGNQLVSHIMEIRLPTVLVESVGSLIIKFPALDCNFHA